jgi:hypothetical protein
MTRPAAPRGYRRKPPGGCSGSAASKEAVIHRALRGRRNVDRSMGFVEELYAGVRARPKCPGAADGFGPPLFFVPEMENGGAGEANASPLVTVFGLSTTKC